MQVRIPDPAGWQRLIQALAATRPGGAVLSRILARIDGLVSRLSGGRHTATTLLTGLPIIHLTTYGAVTGQPRVCPLIPIPDGEKLVVFATNFGARRDPAWARNLAAHPQAQVTLNGVSAAYTARPAEETERARYWSQAIGIYTGYAAYARRAGGRIIPIFVLSPDPDPGGRRSGP